MKKCLLLVLACFALSGCMTSLLLQDSDVKKTHTETHQDKITAFGVVQKTQQLAMIGENYTFLVDESVSEKLMPILTAELPKPYQVVKGYDDLTPKGLSVEMREARGTIRFFTEITLVYLPQNAAEAAKLKKLGFTKITQHKHYVLSLRVLGEVYQSGKLSVNHKQFDTPLPLTIHSQTKSFSWKALALPVTAALDIVTLPAVLLALDTLEVE